MKPFFEIQGKRVGGGGSTFVIAEAGINHNGDFELAKRMVSLASECGADAVKFQTFVTRNVESISAGKPTYFMGREASPNKIQFSRRLELSVAQFGDLKQQCEGRGLVFLSTACDTLALDLLLDLHVSAIKIGSSDTNNFPLLRKAAQTGLPILLSTGISTMAEVEAAVNELKVGGCTELLLMQCTSSYPLPPEDAHLRVVKAYRKRFGCPIGFSDHTEGRWASLAAVAMGAAAIEKHFTISRLLPGVDHPASAEPEEITALVKEIRLLEQAFGSRDKKVCCSEREHLLTMRKSLVAARDLACGVCLTPGDILVKRPGTGIPPSEIDSVLGLKTQKELRADDILTWDVLGGR